MTEIIPEIEMLAGPARYSTHSVMWRPTRRRPRPRRLGAPVVPSLHLRAGCGHGPARIFGDAHAASTTGTGSGLDANTFR